MPARLGQAWSVCFNQINETNQRNQMNRVAIAAPELRGNRSMVKNSYTAIVEKDGDLYVALCPELDSEVFITRFEAAHG
jgi:hypothetical protein